MLLIPNWINKFGGISVEIHGIDYESPVIAVRESNSEVYIAGDYASDIGFPLTNSLAGGTFNQGLIPTTGSGNENGYLARFNGSNDLTWCSSFSGDGTDNQIGDILVTDDAVFICGTADISSLGVATPCVVPAVGEFPYCNLSGVNYTESNASSDRMFLAKFDLMDNLQWSTAFGDDSLTSLRGMDANSSDLYIAGIAGPSNTLWEFDMGSPTDYYKNTNISGDDATIARFDLNFTVGLNNEVSRDEGFSLYPNPSNNLITINSENFEFEKVEIYNGIGQLVLNAQLSGKKAVIDVFNLNVGLYHVVVTNNNGQRFSSQLVKY
ncbi:MAG: hypothetical protein ACI9J3_002549 [Parvicellaceae bacterium]